MSEEELKHGKRKHRHGGILCGTIAALAIIAAVSFLAAVLWFPVLRICSSSMFPSVKQGEIVIAAKHAGLRQGDIIAFRHDNKILVRRIIAGSGSLVEMDTYGNLCVDGKPLDEPYLTERAYGKTDIKFPYQVPQGQYFVMGDHRSASVDSRNTALGCVSAEQVIGKVIFRIWPLADLGNM